MSAKQMDSKDFDEVVSGDKPVLVDFHAAWCGPCQMMGPIIDEMASEAEKFDVKKIDIDESPEITAKYNVMSVPTFIIFKGGKEVGRMMGAMPKELIVEKINEALK